MDIPVKSFNITTAQKKIDLKTLFGSRKVVVVNEEIENGIFYNPNPAALSVRTAPEAITVTDATGGNSYDCADTSKITEGDILEITQSGVVYYAEVLSIDPNVSFIVSGITTVADDVIVNPPYKLCDGLIIDSTYFTANGLLVQHKDNTDTTLYNLSIVGINDYSVVKKK